MFVLDYVVTVAFGPVKSAVGGSTCDSVILSRFWRRISLDISGLVAAGRALSPECGFFLAKYRERADPLDAFR